MTPRKGFRRAVTVALMVALTTTSCAATDKEQPMPTTSEFSQLTDAGIADIERSRHARFDLRNRELTREAVGLAGSSMGPIVGGPDWPTITLDLVGPDRMESVATKSMAFASSGEADAPFDSIAFWREFGTVEQSLTTLNDDITRWGLNADRVRAWEDNSTGEKNFQRFVSMGIGPSGLVIAVEAYLKNGTALFKYEVYLEPEYYTPESLELIRSTGLSR